MKMWFYPLALVLSASVHAADEQTAGSVNAADADWRAPDNGNPLIPGYYADPSILKANGRWFIYATIDPWGGQTLGVWESADFANWTYHELNWPTKAVATSPTSNANNVWAPSVIKGRDDRYWMYVSVGSEIWVGVADNPLGPWRDALGGRPLIPGDYRPGFHMIDAEAFIDDDGQAYLYWGSGLEWVNGHCFVVKLKPDMVSFDGEPRDITPGHYFEAPFMVKRGGTYYLMYSYGKTTEDSYQVRYATGSSPLGPFTEAPDGPLLATTLAKQVISPGHHAVFNEGGQTYILYHRQALPFTIGQKDVLRQIAVDRLTFGKTGIDKVEPSHAGAHPGDRRRADPGLRFVPLASSSADAQHGPERLRDNNYATLWRAGGGAEAWVQADLGTVRRVTGSRIRPEYPGRPYRIGVQLSLDGKTWQEAAPMIARQGSPLEIAHPGSARYVRLSVEPGAGIFEWSVQAGASR